MIRKVKLKKSNKGTEGSVFRISIPREFYTRIRGKGPATAQVLLPKPQLE